MKTRGQILYEFARGESAYFLPWARVLETTRGDWEKAAIGEGSYDDGRYIDAETSRMIDKEMERNVDKFWMCLTGNGGEPVVRHTSQEAAINEAKRLANEYKHDTYVLEVVDVIRPHAAPTIHEIVLHANNCGWERGKEEPRRLGLWRVCCAGRLPELVALGVRRESAVLQRAGWNTGEAIPLERNYHANAQWFRVDTDGSDLCDIPF